MNIHILKEKYWLGIIFMKPPVPCERNVIVAGGPVARVTGVAVRAGVVAGYFSPPTGYSIIRDPLIPMYLCGLKSVARRTFVRKYIQIRKKHLNEYKELYNFTELINFIWP